MVGVAVSGTLSAGFGLKEYSRQPNPPSDIARHRGAPFKRNKAYVQLAIPGQQFVEACASTA